MLLVCSEVLKMLMQEQGDYNLIEFSEEGYAFVARKISQVDYITRLKTLQSIEELRSSNYDEQLVKNNGHFFVYFVVISFNIVFTHKI